MEDESNMKDRNMDQRSVDVITNSVMVETEPEEYLWTLLRVFDVF